MAVQLLSTEAAFEIALKPQNPKGRPKKSDKKFRPEPEYIIMMRSQIKTGYVNPGIVRMRNVLSMTGWIEVKPGYWRKRK